MKIEQLLVQHFYQHRQITLQGLGTFSLAADITLPADGEKDTILPENAISYQYDPKATEDNELISFIVQQTRKIRPLASADLDSYLVLGKQFLNIGKPFVIEGMGMLEKNQLGEYEFKQGAYSNTKIETAPAALKEKDKADERMSFAAPSPRPSGMKPFLRYGLVGVLLIAVAATAWYFLHKRGDSGKTAVNTTDTVSTPPPVVVKKDSAPVTTTVSPVPAKDSAQALAPAADGYTFRVVFKVTNNKAAALARMDDLIRRGHQVIMYTTDSVTFKLAEPYKLPLADTAHVRDSLNKFYYSNKAYIELH